MLWIIWWYHVGERQQQETTLQDLILNYNNIFIKYKLLHAIFPTVRPSRLGPNTNNNYKISSTRSNKIQLIKPISATLDTQLHKNTKKNPHLYP